MTARGNEQKPTIRDVATEIAASLRAAGYVAYFGSKSRRDVYSGSR